ncbi:MAG: 4Fe-4S dicluster domain-containing protein [Gemmatimonadota bacterium]
MRQLPGDRRDFFRDSMGEWFEKLLADTEQRLVPDRKMRPPGALPEVGFLAACTRCGACAPPCPVHAILFVPPSGGFSAGTPYIDPKSQPCTVCPDMPCARACPTGALAVPTRGWEGYRLGKVEFVPERCVTYEGTPCQVCVDACPVGPRALSLDEAGHPVLKFEGCVGCGVCVRECITYPSSFVLTPAEG